MLFNSWLKNHQEKEISQMESRNCHYYFFLLLLFKRNLKEFNLVTNKMDPQHDTIWKQLWRLIRYDRLRPKSFRSNSNGAVRPWRNPFCGDLGPYCGCVIGPKKTQFDLLQNLSATACVVQGEAGVLFQMVCTSAVKPNDRISLAFSLFYRVTYCNL